MTGAASQVTAGTRDDLISGRSLADLAPFFGSGGAATRFVKLALGDHWPALAALAPRVRCVDVGGGEGIVAEAVLREADRLGVDCDIVVLDANQRFLHTASGRRLETRLGTPEELDEGCAELVLLRFVNHYQSAAGQRALAAQVARLLVPGGFLAAQIHTAAEPVCVLFDEIARWISGDPSGGGRHWAPLNEFRAVFESAGLRCVDVIGEDVPDTVSIDDLVDDAWIRVHAQALQVHLQAGAAAEASAFLAARAALRECARQLASDRGLPRLITTTQPIVVMRSA